MPDLVLSPEDSVRHGIHKVLSSRTLDLCARLRIWRKRPLPGPLHDLRVSLLRFRFCLVLLTPWLEVPDRLRRDLAWFGRSLGELRDQDVVLRSSRFWMAAYPEQAPRISGVLRSLRRSRQKTLRGLARKFSSQRGRGLVPGLLGVAGLRLRSTDPAHGTFLALAPELLRRAGRRVRRRRRYAVEDLDRAELHQVRIGFKRLRYACEVLLPRFPKLEKPRRWWLSYQDVLGTWRDADLAVHWLLRLLRRTAPQSGVSANRESLSALLSWQRARAEKAKRRFRARWTKLPRRWRRWRRLRRGLGIPFADADRTS